MLRSSVRREVMPNRKTEYSRLRKREKSLEMCKWKWKIYGMRKINDDLGVWVWISLWACNSLINLWNVPRKFKEKSKDSYYKA